MSKKKSSDTEKRIVKKLTGGAIPLLGVALALFIVTGAIYLLFNRLFSDMSGNDLVTGWEYTYSDTSDVKYRSDLMRIYNSQNPIVTGDAHHDYVYFIKTFEASDEPRTLTILTDHSPVRIIVNGHERYNDRYSGDGSAAYTGNCYNSIVIDPSARDVQVEVFMRIPFSVRFEATMTTGDHATSFEPSGFFYAGCVLCVIALIGSFILFILSFKKKISLRSSAAFLVLAYSGAVEALYVSRDYTYLLNEPIWTNIISCAMFLTVFLLVLMLTRFVRRSRLIVVLTLLSFAMSSALLIIADAAWSLKAASGCAAVFGTLCAAVITRSTYKSTVARTQFASGLLVFSAYLFLSSAIGGLCLFFRKTDAANFFSVFPSIVILVALLIIDRVHVSVAEEKARLAVRSRLYGDCVDKLSSFIRKVLGYETTEQFLNNAPEAIAALAESYEETEDGTEHEIYYCAAKKDDTEYVEYVNNDVEDCQYQIIERNLFRDNSLYFFSGTYFEMVFRPANTSVVIFHFEGLTCCLDRFFIDLMESAYSGLEAALEKIVKSDKSDDVTILEHLAQAAEMSDGYYASHGENVERFTRAICEKMGLDEETARRISYASKYHDIGKFAIPRGIIRKEGRLSDEERAIVNEHSEYGYKLLSAFSDNEEIALAAEIARYHHEHYDGSGRYGLAEDKIPLSARIVAVGDTFDALTSERSYKKAWSFEDAAVELKRCSGTVLDPEVVSAFLGSLTEFIKIKLDME